MQLTDDQRAILTLWYVVNASLSSYYKLIDAFQTPKKALMSEDWQKLGIHKAHLARLEDKASVKAFLYGVQDSVNKDVYRLLFDLPEGLKQLYDPPPVLFYRGNIKHLFEPSLAIVGTRTPSDYAQKISFDMAQYLVQAGFVIVSGLAVGVDSFAHQGALAQPQNEHLGKTVGVMGTGIDICYPKQNQGLFFEIVEAGGCLISELLPGTPASKHTFPRRNRLVTGLTVATIVTEAAIQSGSMISARLAAEQGKQVFVVPNRIDTPLGEGCHHLIREGATLIYHPKQIIEELSPVLSMPSTFSALPSVFDKQKKPSPVVLSSIKTSKTTVKPTDDIPPHLQAVFALIDETPKDLDALVNDSGLEIATLLVQLTELELLGAITQLGGRYGRV